MSKFTDELRGRPNLPSFEDLLDYRDEQRRKAADLLDEAEKALEAYVKADGMVGQPNVTIAQYDAAMEAAHTIALTTLARIRGEQ